MAIDPFNIHFLGVCVPGSDQPGRVQFMANRDDFRRDGTSGFITQTPADHAGMIAIALEPGPQVALPPLFEGLFTVILGCLLVPTIEDLVQY